MNKDIKNKIEDEVKNIVGNFCKIRKEEKNLSQEEVAEKMGKTQSAYARIEREATKIDLATLCAFAYAMDMSVIDVIAYPKKMIARGELVEKDTDFDIDTIVQLRLKNKLKETVLEQVFGNKDIELLKG